MRWDIHMTVEATPTIEPARPKSDERVMAALSHGSIILPFWGLIASIFIWVLQKDKSAYIRFQSLQAVAFHIVSILFSFIGFACYFLTFFLNFGSIFMLSNTEPTSGPPPMFFLTFMLPFAVFGLMMLIGLVFIIYGIVAAVLTAQGKDFQYIVIGNRVKQFLQSD
jgi:uncharacterized Tic20 family protein